MFISVSSLKGGTGKSTVCVNLALALASRKMKVLIFDADFGANNVDLYMDVETKYDINDFLNNNVDFHKLIVSKNQYIDVISGNSGTLETSNLTEEKINYIIQNLRNVYNDYDFILIDTAPSLHQSVINFCLMSDAIIVVTNQDFPSMMDNYQLIKILLQNNFNNNNIYLLVNRGENEKNSQTIYLTINNVIYEYLNGLNIKYLGFIEDSKVFLKSVAEKNQIYNKSFYFRKKFNEMADVFINIKEGL